MGITNPSLPYKIDEGDTVIRLFKANQFDELVEALNQSFQRDFGCVLLLEGPLPEKQAHVLNSTSGVICFATPGRDSFQTWSENSWPSYICGFVRDPSDPAQLMWALEEAQRILNLRLENEQLKTHLRMEKEKSEQILQATLELSNEKDPHKLSEKILSTMRGLTHAEGATLYIYEPESNEIRSAQFQNEILPPSTTQIRLPVDESSMAGACAFKGEIIQVSHVDQNMPDSAVKHHQNFDHRAGYRTHSSLCFPLSKTNGDLVGVIQLVNSKREGRFSKEDVALGRALTGPIASALETALLYKDIENLFEGFIKASVTAIESRDPTTSGHSERVADYSVCLAEKVSLISVPEFKGFYWNEMKAKELRYASLLHDFGKIGVPEAVLLKEKKLYPNELNDILYRVKLLKVANPDEAEELENFLKTVLRNNEPTVQIKTQGLELETFVDRKSRVLGEEVPWLTSMEWTRLSISKGSLTPEDRLSIESHVTHTYKFLSQIPWTKGLKQVPHIARAHHERLDGTGYPLQLKAEDIPLESQIMAVADIYDALTASDRPYKKSLSIDRALEILSAEAASRKLNASLVQVFKEQKAYKTTR